MRAELVLLSVICFAVACAVYLLAGNAHGGLFFLGTAMLFALWGVNCAPSDGTREIEAARPREGFDVSRN